MKYIDEFRDGELAKNLAQSIAATVQPGRSYSFMEFCGGHTHAISRYGLSDLLPPNVRMVHGPGCPVCVLPVGRVDLAIKLALKQGAILCTYGDTLRVPASDGLSLMKAKAGGGDIRMVYSTIDALQIARDNPGREVVFFAIGFETTTPPTAVAIQQAAHAVARNGVGMATAKFHEAVVAPGLDRRGNAGAKIPRQFAIAEFVDVLHEGAPASAFISANSARVFSASSGSSLVSA